ncbi:MAG TPA: poly(3-hydroxybutyrate) depolymerase [Nitrospira sp.]|nr:poly(3-hydroxybutyrate) depolymerase [Nitrospira sp.]
MWLKGCDGRLIIPLQNLNQLCPRLVNRNVIGNLYRLIAGCVVLSFHITTAACSENTTPPQLEAFTYPTTAGHCLAGSRSGVAGATDGRVSAEGIKYMVRTPSNYDATFTHPLLMVYAPAGMSRWASERLTGLTTEATRTGFVVVYADHKQLNLSTVEQLGMIPGQVAKEWCIDETRVYATGHSDGGTASLALAVLDKTKTIPAAIAPSAAGWRGKDLEEFQCPAPIPVMIMHGKHDTLFPGWGAQTSAWWATCHGCDVSKTKTKTLEGGCRVYQGCASGGATVYCEGSGGHRDWPNLNRVMLEFFAHPEKFL